MPNFQEDFLRGQEFAAKRQEWEAQNALRSAMGQYGAAAAEGDQNALRELAKHDPKYALGMMDTRQGMDLRTKADARQAEAHSSGLQLDQARLDQIREQSRMAASDHSMKMDEATRARELEETTRTGTAMSMAWQKGPEEFARFMGSEAMKDAPPELRGLSYEDAPYGIAMLGGAAEGFQAPAAPEPTAEMRNLEFRATQAGLQPGTPEWQQFMAQGGAPRGTTLSVGPDGAVQFREGPLGADNKQQRQEDMRTTTSDVITGAAGRAADLSGDFATTGLLGNLASRVPNTPAAQLRGEVETLRSNASLANIAAMRAASPTGAGMGNPTDTEHRMLQAAAGALNPDAKPEVFQRQLADYERTLLRIVHGTEAGDKIWREQGLGSRGFSGDVGATGGANPPPAAPTEIPQSARDAGIDPDLWQYLSPEDQALWN